MINFTLYIKREQSHAAIKPKSEIQLDPWAQACKYYLYENNLQEEVTAVLLVCLLVPNTEQVLREAQQTTAV